MKNALLFAPVTALEFCGKFLLAGEGPVLHVYHLQEPPRKCASLNVLHNYRIHGIRPKRLLDDALHPERSDGDGQEELVVFGGKGLQIIRLGSQEKDVKLNGPLLELQDWILDIQWFSGDPCPLLSVSLAHNALLILKPDSGSVHSFSSCAETCLLYSALTVGPQWDSLVVMGGTVFNQIVLWIPKGNRSQVEQRLVGHTGVIFNLCYLQNPGWLASASDDRSVRLWNVGVLGGNAGCGEESPACLRVLYGHQARVFCVRLTQSRIISAGEDGACLVWEWAGEGKVGQMFKGHRSGGLRAMAARHEWIATGGADGGIRLWFAAEDKELIDTREETRLDLGFEAQGCPKVVRFLDKEECGSTLVCTDHGEVCLRQDETWQVIWRGREDFQSYCVMELTTMEVQNSSSVVSVCAVGNLTGHVQIFLVHNPDVGLLLRAGTGKVHSVIWVREPSNHSGRWSLLASGSEGLVYRWRIDVVESQIGLKVTEQRLVPFLLPPCAKCWLTAAISLSGRSYLCGDRRGSLLLYTENQENVERTMDDADQEASITALSPVSTLFGVHGKQGVTFVCQHEELCYSAGRDGCVRIVTVEETALKVRRVQRACRGMEWLEKILFCRSDPPGGQPKMLEEMMGTRREAEEARFVIAGFHSVHFVIWDPRRQEKLLSVLCGGGHRSWDYCPKMPGSSCFARGTLVFLKHGAVMASRPLASTKNDKNGCTVKEGLHGRGIGCVCRLGRVGRGGDVWEVLVTGGEDTTVCVLALQRHGGRVEVLAVLTDHISNVRALAAIRSDGRAGDETDGTTSLSSLVFSAGGRAQLQCNRLFIRLDDDLSHPSCQVTQITGHRLDERWERKRHRHKTVKMDPETRYMSVAVVHAGVECILLALGCSDGAVRLFAVNEADRSVEMLWECFYHQRCVLSVATCRLEDSHGKDLLLLFSATTDGCISVWDLTAVLNGVSWQGPTEPFFSIPVHQSGVNTLSLSQLTDTGLISVASGGDDGKLSVLHIRIVREPSESAGMSVQIHSRRSAALAHAAPLTGLCPLSATLLASTSPDQRVCVWRVTGGELCLQKVLFSHTADAAGLCVWSGQDDAWVLVCGQGLQLFHFKECEMNDVGEMVPRKRVAISDYFF